MSNSLILKSMWSNVKIRGKKSLMKTDDIHQPSFGSTPVDRLIWYICIRLWRKLFYASCLPTSKSSHFMSFMSDLSTREPKLVQFLLKRRSPLKEPAGSENSQSSSYASSVRLPKQLNKKSFIQCTGNQVQIVHEDTKSYLCKLLSRILWIDYLRKSLTLNLFDNLCIWDTYPVLALTFAFFRIEDINVPVLCPYIVYLCLWTTRN